MTSSLLQQLEYQQDGGDWNCTPVHHSTLADRAWGGLRDNPPLPSPPRTPLHPSLVRQYAYPPTRDNTRACHADAVLPHWLMLLIVAFRSRRVLRKADTWCSLLTTRSATMKWLSTGKRKEHLPYRRRRRRRHRRLHSWVRAHSAHRSIMNIIERECGREREREREGEREREREKTLIDIRCLRGFRGRVRSILSPVY